jgi:acyl-CoA thioester hydrolase
MSPSSVTIEASVRVIYGDTDQMGVVYYANYFRYFEFSRSEYFRARGGNYAQFEKQGYGLPVVQAHADYKMPARYEDELLVAVHIAELRRASLEFRYEVTRKYDCALLCTGYTLHACIHRQGRATRLPEFLLALLR